MNIYTDTPVCEWNISQLNLSNITTYNTTSDYLASESGYACYHVPFPPNQNWLTRFHATYSHSKHNIVLCSELHEHTVDQLLTLDLPNTSIFTCGTIDHTWSHAQIYKWMDWFITPAYFYREVFPNFLDERLLPQENKPKMFDILLGALRSHRDFIYNYVSNSAIKDQVIMTYSQTIDQPLFDNDQFIIEPEVEALPNVNITHTIHYIKYFGYETSISRVIPITVYNQSYYSLVAETNFFNHFNFYTEKIAKPIMAGRLFIAIAGQHYLKNLRAMGFKTFDSVIDESYDTESDNESRWRMALEQVEYLCDQDPQEVYKQIQPIIDHNRNRLLEYNWQDELLNDLRKIFNS